MTPYLADMVNYAMIRDHPIMILLLLMLCCSALIIYLNNLNNAQEQGLLSDYYAIHLQFCMNISLHLADNFIKTVLLECINE